MAGEQRDDQWYDTLRKKSNESDKDWGTAFILSLFLGLLGIDRFYLGDAAIGSMKLITFGGMGLWWFYDIVLLLLGRMRDSEDRVLKRPF